MEAQQKSYAFQHIISKDGLVSDNVHCIFQDSKGYYWIGTENGLQRFDGKQFQNKAFQKERSGNISLIAEAVYYPILEDKLGNIWAHNVGSISVFHPLTNRVSRIKIKDDAMHPGVINIQNFCKGEQGDMWIVTGENIYTFDYNKQEPILWLPIQQRAYKSYQTFILYDSTNKALWLARDRDVFRIDVQTKKIERPFADKQSDNSKRSYFNVFWMDSKENLWLSDFEGFLYKYNTRTYKKEIYRQLCSDEKGKTLNKKPYPSAFVEDSHGTIWISSYYGDLAYYNKKQNIFQAIAINNNLSSSLHYDHYINTLFRDDEGNIWAGTDKGINIFNPAFQQFTTVDESNVWNPFPKTEVTKVFQTSSGDILVSTWGKGLFVYDKGFRQKKRFYQNDKLYTKSTENRRNLVWSLAEDKDGKVWIGHQRGLIGIYDTATQRIQYIHVPLFDGKTVMAIQCDEKGNMWFGLYSGFLGKWDRIKKKFIIYKDLLHLSPEEQAPISSILITKQHKVWVSTNGNGFYCFDPEREEITESYTDAKYNAAPDNAVNSVTQINDSIIGVSTNSKGFLLFNTGKRTFSSFTIKDGLPTNCVYGLAQDKEANLWIATTSGLLRWSRNKPQLTSFEDEEGLLCKRFIGNIASLRNGDMVIPTSTGFVYFSPDRINKLPPPHDVQITGLKIFNEPLSVDSVLNSHQTVQLSHQQNFITIGYGSLGFLGRNTTRYFYRLEGLDKAWIEAGEQRFATYTNLAPGHYTFNVKCENRDGIPSKEMTTLHINIRSPWWATRWAYAIYLIVSGSIVYLLYRKRINSIKRKQAEQIQTMVATQEEERRRIARDLHDEVGVKLSALKLILSSLYEKTFGIKNEEIQSLTLSSESLISEAVQDVRRLLLNLSPGVLEDFGYATAVEGLVNKINQTKQPHFNLVIFGIHQRLQKDYELALYRITQELINNILKHAEARQVSLQIGQRDAKIILLIEDDGRGFDVDSQKDGYGLHNLDIRTKLMNGTMTIDSQPGKGTSVLIEIPYNLN